MTERLSIRLEQVKDFYRLLEYMHAGEDLISPVQAWHAPEPPLQTASAPWNRHMDELWGRRASEAVGQGFPVWIVDSPSIGSSQSSAAVQRKPGSALGGRDQSTGQTWCAGCLFALDADEPDATWRHPPHLRAELRPLMSRS